MWNLNEMIQNLPKHSPDEKRKIIKLFKKNQNNHFNSSQLESLWIPIKRLLKASMGNCIEDTEILDHFLRATHILRKTDFKGFEHHNREALKFAISLEWSQYEDTFFKICMNYMDYNARQMEFLREVFEKYYDVLPIRSKCEVLQYNQQHASYHFQKLFSASQIMRAQISNCICNNKILQDDDIAELIACSIKIVDVEKADIWFELQDQHKIFDHMLERCREAVINLLYNSHRCYEIIHAFLCKLRGIMQYKKRLTFASEFMPVFTKTLFVFGGALIDAASMARSDAIESDENSITYGAIGIAVSISQHAHHFQLHSLDTRQHRITEDDWAVSWARRIEGKLRVHIDLSKPLEALNRSDFNTRVLESEKRNRGRSASLLYFLTDNNKF